MSYASGFDSEYRWAIGPRSCQNTPDRMSQCEPSLRITPETHSASTSLNRIWVALEVLTTRSHAYSVPSKHFLGADRLFSNSIGSLTSSNEDDDWGIVDVEMEINASHDCRIIQIVKEGGVCPRRPFGLPRSHMTMNFPKIGSSGCLVMILVELPSIRSGSEENSAPRYSSAFTDLEIQLGCHVVEFLNVVLEFRQQVEEPAQDLNFVINQGAQRRIQGSGIIKRHDTTSIWAATRYSHPPVDFFPTMASHWGQARAHEVSYSLSTKASSVFKDKGAAGLIASPRPLARTSSHEIESERVPQRRTSLQRTPSPQPLLDRAQQIWLTIRRAHSGDQPEPRSAFASRNTSLAGTSLSTRIIGRASGREPSGKENLRPYQ